MTKLRIVTRRGGACLVFKSSNSADVPDKAAYDRTQRNFELMQRQVESWRQTQITDAQGNLRYSVPWL